MSENLSKSLAISVIITTYNQPEWLKKTLFGFENQDTDNFEILIADDGSGQPTKEVITFFQSRKKLKIQHIWHQDEGFKKCEILNKAIVASKYNYLLFTDGDCIPKNNFVSTHQNLAKKGYFLSGGYFKLNKIVSDKISEEDIIKQNPFNTNWLRHKGQPFTYKMLKFNNTKLIQNLANLVTPTKATWNGHNVSGWKEDILAVNGYNEEMQYGGLDRELGERLGNFGIKGKQIRYSTICVHLDHSRPYKTKNTLTKNREIRNKVKTEKIKWAQIGITK